MAKVIAHADKEIAIVRAFQLHKKSHKLHVTPDGQCFLEGNKSFADLHARKNKFEVETVERKNYEVPVEEPVIDYSEGKKKLAEGAKTDSVEKPKTSEETKDYDSMSIPALKDLLITREIEFKSKDKKPVLIALLQAADAAKSE